jgi:ATP-dependent helicase HrpB
VNRKIALPVDTLLPQILEALGDARGRSGHLVLEAAPGAGKTTRVPPALLNLVSGEVLVLEPRRIAARLAARRVASELGEQPGETVGYQVRLEEVAGPRTRLRFMTEGVLTRRLLSDPDLRGVDAVVLDEFHERHLDSDLALALLRRLGQRRASLRLLVMSATLDSASVARFLDNAPILRSEGRLFPLTVTNQPYSPEPLEAQVARAVELLLREGQTGDMLVFLPGAAEIRRAMRACEELARRAELLMLPLHGSLPPEEQDRAVAPSARRKLILATNVAESSITIDGVSAVIDSGLARIATWSPWTGLPTLEVARISKASATQRAGRAGRTGPGRVVRLYPAEDFQLRPDHETPEILRGDLSQLCLALRAMGIGHPDQIDWLDAPPEAAVRSAETLLDRLGAQGEEARRLVRMPLPPRLARMVLSAKERGAGEDACLVAALLGSGATAPHADLLHTLDLIRRNPEPALRQHVEQVRRAVRPPRQTASNDDALLQAILTGFPDRVARRRTGARSASGAGNQALLSSGGSAELAGEPGHGEFLVAIDAEDRKDKPLPLIRLSARIEAEWLLDFFPERLQERIELTWNARAERVEAMSRLFYDELVLQESRHVRPDPQQAAELLARKALDAGIERFIEPEALAQLIARAEFAGAAAPDWMQPLRELCQGLTSFAELRAEATHLLPLLERTLAGGRLADLAPTSLRLPSGRQTRVHYEAGKPPWIASRLQDFFGMRETPLLGPARRPVVVHLLAPNQRPVQMTTDLAGFWDRLYPQVRRELMRRYPRHQWPEKP